MNVFDKFRYFNIIQIGCGGTGSWLMPLLTKFLYNINTRVLDHSYQKLEYTLIDFDTVEERNILRQNFTAWDIGKEKNKALVNRYCHDWGNVRTSNLDVKPQNFTKFLLDKLENVPDNWDVKNNTTVREAKYDQYFHRFQAFRRHVENSLTVIFGCVDNIRTRNHIYNVFKTLSKEKYSTLVVKNLMWRNPDSINRYNRFKYMKVVDFMIDNKFIYIDSGNNLHNGQICTLWENFDYMCNDSFAGYNNPQVNFKKKFKIEENDPEENTGSCAFFGDQSQSINSLAATLMFCNFQKIMINAEMPPSLIEFNSSGYSTFEI